MATRLAFDETRTKLIAAMPCIDGGVLAAADDVALREGPAWIREFGAVRDGVSLWLWLAPVAVGAPAGMGQAVCDMPEGRYVVECYDVRGRAWVSRESAQAPPLVIGVPRRAGAIVLRVTAQLRR